MSALRTRRRALAAALAAAALAVYPAAVGWIAAGVGSAFGFFAMDAFYYLTIARHPFPFPAFSFDGIHPTNGFHPLWQAFLALAFRGLGLIGDQAGQIAFAHWVGVGCVALAAGLAAWVAARLLRSAPLALFAAAPGFLALVNGAVLPGRGDVWGFANGMESPFSLLIFALLLILWRRGLGPEAPAARLAGAGALASLLILARLDDVFMLAALAAPFAPAAWARGRALTRAEARALALLLGVPAAVLAAYLAANLVWTGAAFPVSGAAKGGFALFGNLRDMVGLLAPVDAIRGGWLESWRDMAARPTFLLGPALVAALFLLHARRRGAWDRTDRLFAALALYVLLKAAYALVLVNGPHQGHWYFPVSTLVASLQIALMVDRRMGGRAATGAAVWPALALTAAVSAFFANASLSARMDDETAARMLKFWTERGRVSAELARIDPEMRIVSYDDGIVAYALDPPVMSGFRFTLDPAAARAAAEGRLLGVAWERGFRYIASLNNFPDFADPSSEDAGDELTRRGWLSRPEWRRWRVTLVWRDPETGFKLLRFAPRTGG